MLLVEGPGTRLKALVESMPEWVLTPAADDSTTRSPTKAPEKKLRKRIELLLSSCHGRLAPLHCSKKCHPLDKWSNYSRNSLDSGFEES
jgi:hypothetical protein